MADWIIELIEEHGYPSTNEGLSALMLAPGGDPRWKGPYLKDAIPRDPWGTPYRYASPSLRGKEYDLSSLGRDRAPGGTGEDADVTN